MGGARLTAPRKYADWYARGFEPRTVAWLRGSVSGGASVVDVGAHVGFLTLLLSQLVGTHGHVYAVEPAPDNLRWLRRNIRRNAATNVHILPHAAGRERRTRALRVTGSSDSHGFYDHPLTRTQGSVPVAQVPLDDLIPAADLIKIDVEGAELEVLDGMGRLLAQRPRLLLEWMPECQRAAGHAAEDLVERLRSLGYDLQVLDDLHGRTVTTDRILRELRAGELSPSWYANLACRPC